MPSRLTQNEGLHRRQGLHQSNTYLIQDINRDEGRCKFRDAFKIDFAFEHMIWLSTGYRRIDLGESQCLNRP